MMLPWPMSGPGSCARADFLGASMGAWCAILVASECNVRTIGLECPDPAAAAEDSQAWVCGSRYSGR
jgi:hypothetical protein